MKHLLFIITLLAMSISAMAEPQACRIIITELPYTEGMVYISAKEGKDEFFRMAIEVDSDFICVPVDFSKVIGKKVFIQAFQDLNEDRQLNFDSYGRPSEPFLQTTVEPKEELEEYRLQLTYYESVGK